MRVTRWAQVGAGERPRREAQPAARGRDRRVEAELRRLKRCERTRKDLPAAFARFAEATGRPGMTFEAFFALAPAERLELLESAPAECTALGEAWERRRAAFDEARRHHERTA